MAPTPAPVPNKRARGSYAKFICFACRERRIKCQLPENVTIQPSSEPQPPATSCRRCQQQGLDCIVRKTTLGRPNQKRPRSSTPPAETVQDATDRSRSPSPAVEDFVLLNLDKEAETKPAPDIMTPSSIATNASPTSTQLMEAIGKTFELTSTLISRDRRFGRLGIGLQDVTPSPIQDIISESVAATLDQYLVWQRLYMPHLPSLAKLHREVKHVDPNTGLGTSTILLLALLCSIALDVPTDAPEVTNERHLQSPLRTIIFQFGQRMMFSLVRHDYTLACLELIIGYRPLALMSSRQASAQCLNGPLLPNLTKMAAQRLGTDYAPTKLRASLQSTSSSDVRSLCFDTIRWTRCLMRDLYEDLGVDRSMPSLRPSSGPLKEALDAVGDAIETGRAPEEILLPYHIRRTHADGLLLVRLMAADWQNLPKLATHIHQLSETQQKRKADLERHLQSYYGGQAREKSLALSQLYVMDQGVAQADAIGLACFLAVMSTSLAASSAGPNFDLNKYYTECINAEVAGKDWSDDSSRQSGVRSFLELFGDPHIEALEKRLTDFINVATDLRLHGIPFVGPSSETAEDVMMACKMIVENNAVRIKIDGRLSSRIDVHLILFQEAARRLEAMEAGGDGPDAIARGSVFAASAKLIRSLHRILWQWKRNYLVEVPPDMQARQADINLQPAPTTDVNQQETFAPMYASATGTDDFFADGIFTDWQNWPQLDAAELSNMFNFDFDEATLPTFKPSLP